MTTHIANSKLCPLCNRNNNCAVAQGNNPADCWCMSTAIKPEARRLAAAKNGGQRCICQACGQPLTPSDLSVEAD